MKYWPLIAMATTGCYFDEIDSNLALNEGYIITSYKGYLICQSSPRLEPSLIYWDMGHQDPQYLQPVAVNFVGHIDATTSLMGDLNLDLSSECSLINHLTTWHNPLHWIYIRIVSIRYFQFIPHQVWTSSRQQWLVVKYWPLNRNGDYWMIFWCNRHTS